MAVMDVLKRGADFTNADETAKGMMVDFKDHKVGLQLDADEVTQVVKDGILSLEEGIREDCHVVLKMKTVDLFVLSDCCCSMEVTSLVHLPLERFQSSRKRGCLRHHYHHMRNNRSYLARWVN